MASVSESCSNAVHDTSSASQDKVGQFPMFFQGLQIILKDPDKSYQDKVCALLSAWERLASYSNQSSFGDGVTKITDCLYRDTLRVVLRCEWAKLPQANKTHLTVTLQRTAASLANTPAGELCNHVIQLIKNPWENPVLTKIATDSDINDAEALEFCVAENPVLLSVRLDILCESDCEDIALRLVKVCRKCSSAKDTRFSAMCLPVQLEHWLDLHVALLHYEKKIKEELHPLWDQLTFDEGYQLVKRLIDRGKGHKDPNGAHQRVWAESFTVADMTSHCFFTKALMFVPPPPCFDALIVQLVNLQKLLGKQSHEVMDMLQKRVDRLKSITSTHMLILASTLYAEFGEEFKSLCIELHVRAVAININHQEKLISRRDELNRTSSSPDEASVQEREAIEITLKRGESDLAEALSTLADLVRANVRICKECVLTAFSLEPTTARFEKLVELACLGAEQSKGESSPPLADSNALSVPVTDYHQSTTDHSRNAVVGEPPPGSGGGPGGGSSPSSQERRGSDSSTPDCSSVKEAFEDADSGVDLPDVPNGSCDLSSPATQTSDEETLMYSDAAAASLGVSASVMKDLATVVHVVRWDVLNWDMGWEKLKLLCQQYLANPKMRTVTEELHFLKPDYDQFKHLPRPEKDEFWGIEKGYEIFIDSVEDEPVESPRPRSNSKSNKKSAKRTGRPASGSSSPLPGELAERKKVLKKKVVRKESSPSLKISSDSDSPRQLDVTDGDSAGSAKRQRLKSKKTSPLIKTLRAMRPELSSGTQWTDCTVPTSSTGRLSPESYSNNVQQHLSLCSTTPPSLSTSSSPSSVDEHFAPMLSTLDMNPKVVLKRTPVKSTPANSTLKEILARGSKALQTSPELLRSYVLLDKLDQKNRLTIERTMTNLKGLDNLNVRPQTTAVHMVQLPNPPANAHIATANGLSVSAAGTGTATTLANNGNVEIRQEQPHQQQEETNKASGGNSATSNGEDPPVFTSTTSIEITSAPSGTSLPEPVTLLSTPSVSIFQVAHRPAGTAGAVLQPVAAVTGFNPPNPRLKNPVVGTAARLANRARSAATAVTAVPARPTVEIDLPPASPNITLAQLLAQSSSAEETVAASPATNGPAPPASNKSTGTRGGKRRGATSNSAEVTPNSADGASASASNSSPSPAESSSPCHVPLVKYVDLNMVSSPSRPRPGSTAGMRRLSQGSNSSSPDPHRTANKNHRGNPASPAINSPQSPALQAPPSPLSFRKQQQQSHHIFRGQDNKASPSHPSQCSSPFSRPSSRSQDTSPSPSDLLSGTMFPPNFMPFSSSEGGSNSNHPGASPSPGSSAPAAGRLPSFGASLPSQASAANFPSALPKFGQAFSKKSHFEVIPSLGSLGSPPSNVMTQSTALPAINSIQEPHLQVGRITNNSLGGNGFGGESTRRFPAEQSSEEVEGLGSKLSSLLESALNGQITRSPTRSLPANQPIVSNPDLLLSDSAHSISPLVGGMDSQSGSEVTGSGTTAFTEQLREFESIFAQVRGENPWPDQPDDASFMGVGTVEFLPPPSTFSESMDVSEASLASPHSAEAPSSSQAEEPVSSVTNESPSGGQLHDLLSAASTARQALKNEEKESESSTQSPLAQIKIASVKEEIVEEATTESRSEAETQPFPSPPPVAPPTPKSNPTRVVVLPTVLTGPIVVQAAEPTQQTISSVNLPQSAVTAVKSEPKNNRAKPSAKSTPIVSPGASAANSPSKVTTPTSSSSSSSASSKTPQKAHDDEHTVLRVHAILEEYKEQLRNSPDLQNKPAPRRRSNPLPSPSTSAPKRRKSVQSKVKLLSQHVRPADGLTDGASSATGSVESAPSSEPQPSTSSNASPTAESNKGETNNQATVATNPAASEKPEGAVAVQMIPAGIQLSIPTGAVVTNRPAAPSSEGPSASSASVGTATVTVSAPQGTPLTSLAGVPAVPLSTVLSQHQLLVSTGAAGVQRLQLVPLNFSPARGSSPRGTYIQVRQVTMSGQPGVISFPARFTAPIRYVSAPQQANQQAGQDQAQQQTQQQQIVVASLPKVATSSAGETHLLLQEIPASQATGTILKSSTVSTAPSQPAPVANSAGTQAKIVEPEASSEAIKTETSVATTTATTSVLRLLPTVTKVNLPVPTNSIETPILSPATLPAPVEPSTPTPPPLTLASATIDTPIDSSSVVGAEASTWSHRSSQNDGTAAVDSTVTDSTETPTADEKLLGDVETGVSEFLPCADFMGPGVSPTPCFSLSDSPLGSQESSPVTSPATFQASSTEEDTNSHAITGDDAMLSSAATRKSDRSKILKRNNKPRMVVVRKDHGSMEYRRMSDGEGGPGIIRSETQSLSKRLAARRAAAAAAAGGNTSANSSPARPASRPASPLASNPSSPSAEPAPTKPETKPKSITLTIRKTADKHVTIQKTSDKARQVDVVVVQVPVKVENAADQVKEEVVKQEPMEQDSVTEVTVEMDEAIVTRPRRCSRLRKEPVEEPAEHDAQTCHLGGETKMLRRSSVRMNVKKNCPCCVPGTNEKRKRTKSEPVDNASSDPPTPGKRGSAASQSFTEGATTTTTLTTRLAAANAAKSDSTAANRSKPAKKSQRKR